MDNSDILKFLALSVLFLIVETGEPLNSRPCDDHVYKHISYTQKLVSNFTSNSTANSVMDCLNLCRDHPTCKSVGIVPSTMVCYLYEDRVYAGLPGEYITYPMLYYWLLEDHCPKYLGYIEDPMTRICSKYHNTTDTTWSQAQQECNREGAHLYMMDTLEKKIRLATAYIADIGTKTYLGATNKAIDGQWTWLDGSIVDGTIAFEAGEPNDIGKDCVIYRNISNAMRDSDCVGLKSFICEVPTQQYYMHH